ncbi:MAG: protein-glutamate O-methyltransferase [Proteobacteria bacterium]|nr:protein-glutamate O-methyltransferase [Pseudomonadota bacterium]
MIKDERSQSSTITMSNKDFSRLKDFIYNECGINIGDSKKTMLEARLQKRLRELKLNSFTLYCDYLFSPAGIQEELTDMIDQVTTNKTDFFREPGHFEFLNRIALPHLTRIRKNIFIWSAGCSSGEEPYTLAMVLSEFVNDNRSFNFQILATDISTRVLDKAKLAIYDEERISPVPPDMRNKYLLRNKDRTKKLYRVIPALREQIRFRRLNFMDSDFGFREPMDIIFCRNVIIYFDKPTQERLLNKFCQHLSPDGYLFMGHSETLFGMDVPLTQVAPTIYRRLA